MRLSLALTAAASLATAALTLAGPAAAATTPKAFAAQAATNPLTRPLALDTCMSEFLMRCYGPTLVQRAYGLDGLHKRGIDGRGTTIAIIMNPVNDLRASADLQASTYHLPKPHITVQPIGDPGAPGTGDDAIEGTLDVQAAHTVAPRAKLLFLAVPSPSVDAAVLIDAPLAQAVDAAIAAHADVISMSFGGLEQQYALRRAARAGIPAVTGSGDQGVVNPGSDGRQTFYPATDPNVTAVGGTLLTLNAHGQRELPDVAWGPDAQGGASGGGVAKLDPRPSWQAKTRNTRTQGRNYPDVSLLGASSGSFVVAFGGPQPQFLPIAGTSVATPLFAGMLALARQEAGRPLHGVNPAIYRLARNPKRNGIVDVVLGNNSYGNAADGSGQGTPVEGYLARTGYDLVTGLGTIDARRFVPALARAASPSTRD
jgi:subtilase family serine protease